MKIISSMFALLLNLILPASGGSAATLPIIDTHTHIDPQSILEVERAVESAIQKMDQNGIQRIVLMSPPQAPGARRAYDVDSMRSVAEKYPARVSLAGGGGSLNAIIQQTPPDAVTDEVKQRFRAQAEQLAGSGIVGFGEITVHHLSLRNMGPQHPYEWSPPDHPLMLVLADIAASKGIPIDLHMDLVPEDMDLPPRPIFNPMNPSRLKANLAGFERLLDHNPAAKIIWAHAGTDPLGTRVPQVQRELLKKHGNLYMSVRLGRGGPAPMFALDDEMKLKPAWLALFADYPERFVLGSDFFHSAGGRQRGPGDEALKSFSVLLEQLPPELAAAIGYRNAEKLFRLTPIAR